MSMSVQHHISSFTRALKSLIISLHLVAVDRGGGECGGGCEDKSVCAWEDKILSAFMTKHSKSGLGLPSIVALVMTIDKSWTTISNRNSEEFLDGLFAFIKHCEPLLHPITRKIRCPCSRCCNRDDNFVTLKTLEVHISSHGFDQHYTTWKYHGEPILPLPPPVPHSPEHIDMDAFFEDISANNVPTPPTQTTGPQPAQTTGPNNEFEELLSRSTQKLYPGCDMTTLEFTTEISHIKALHKITDAGFNKILALLQKACSPSKGYNFPSSYYEIKKTYKKIGLGYESIHACINDCFLFWGSEDNLKMPNCPICKASRWKDPKKTKGKKVANKVVRYFPLTPRLQRMFNTKHIAKWMTWHATGQSKENGLAADGFNPFGMMSQNYSMWPVILTTYNTPPWMCMKETSLMLTMLIPGPRSPTKDIDVYLQPLIKELQELWKGVWTKDAATGTHFQMKAAVLWTINDFPARSSLSGWSGQGYHACPTCNEDTPSMSVKSKIVYVGSSLRIETGNASLRKAFRHNNQQPLTLGFDYDDLGTFHPIGDYASMLNSLMGETIRPLPLACEWEEIPEAFKAHIFPTLESYFNLAEWYNNQEKVVVGKNVYTVGERVRLGLQLKLRLLWRKNKNRIKAQQYTIYDSPEEAKNHLPPSTVWGERTHDEWNELVEWFSHPNQVSRSMKNAANRAEHVTNTSAGKISFGKGGTNIVEGDARQNSKTGSLKYEDKQAEIPVALLLAGAQIRHLRCYDSGADDQNIEPKMCKRMKLLRKQGVDAQQGLIGCA
ncbi:CACTA transposable element [Tanacetum coccineum]